jgi:ribosome-binding factor A
MSRENPRRLRIAAELQRVANDLLCNEINDPRLSGVRISAVEVSGDLSLARLFFNTLDPDDDPEPVEQALSRASGFLRSKLGRAVRLRRVPELRFVQDIASRRGMELSRLIDEAVAEERDPDAPSSDSADS